MELNLPEEILNPTKRTNTESITDLYDDIWLEIFLSIHEPICLFHLSLVCKQMAYLFRSGIVMRHGVHVVIIDSRDRFYTIGNLFKHGLEQHFELFNYIDPAFVSNIPFFSNDEYILEKIFPCVGVLTKLVIAIRASSPKLFTSLDKHTPWSNTSSAVTSAIRERCTCKKMLLLLRYRIVAALGYLSQEHMLDENILDEISLYMSENPPVAFILFKVTVESDFLRPKFLSRHKKLKDLLGGVNSYLELSWDLYDVGLKGKYKGEIPKENYKGGSTYLPIHWNLKGLVDGNRITEFKNLRTTLCCNNEWTSLDIRLIRNIYMGEDTNALKAYLNIDWIRWLIPRDMLELILTELNWNMAKQLLHCDSLWHSGQLIQKQVTNCKKFDLKKIAYAAQHRPEILSSLICFAIKNDDIEMFKLLTSKTLNGLPSLTYGSRIYTHIMKNCEEEFPLFDYKLSMQMALIHGDMKTISYIVRNITPTGTSLFTKTPFPDINKQYENLL